MTDAEPPHPRIERSQFGVPERRREPALEDLPPISSTELSKGPTELAEHRGPRVNWRVFVISAAVVLAFSIWAMVMPDQAKETMHTVVTWIATNVGWFYVVTVTLVIIFVLWVALSKEGSVRLGPDRGPPRLPQLLGRTRLCIEADATHGPRYRGNSVDTRHRRRRRAHR
ncbi:BCCT family transporter [Rhodococcus sp. SJ-3]|uniref:BCCT family transporter n=1 Tax=Rhodococcus sp. SJ-3 TaxID=3454628 RepID=UPI003F7AD086